MKWLIYLLAAIMLAGCMVNRSSHHSTSVVQYLFPDDQNHKETPTTPVLHLPLRVGVAFVPESRGMPGVIPEERKLRLLRKVKAHFAQYRFVHDIQIIPSAYLRPGGSFANLDQLATMFGIDVIALVSYDQSRFTGEGAASISYWTILGAYIVPGEKNDTHTMVDTVVYDIASRSLLFRAPGISHIHSHATPVNLEEQLRKDAQQGFDEASADLIQSLDRELAAFRERVKQHPEQYHIEERAGYHGGGAMGWPELLLMLSGFALLLMRRRWY